MEVNVGLEWIKEEVQTVNIVDFSKGEEKWDCDNLKINMI